jgi:hypothetical protein
MTNKQRATIFFSEWVRRKDADYRGLVKCFTCDCVQHWKMMHDGHFCKRSDTATFVDEINNNPQCPYCNIELKGNLEVYAKNLDKVYGLGTADKLKEKARTTVKMSDRDWSNIADIYRRKLINLK